MSTLKQRAKYTLSPQDNIHENGSGSSLCLAVNKKKNCIEKVFCYIHLKTTAFHNFSTFVIEVLFIEFH